VLIVSDANNERVSNYSTLTTGYPPSSGRVRRVAAGVGVYIGPGVIVGDGVRVSIDVGVAPSVTVGRDVHVGLGCPCWPRRDGGAARGEEWLELAFSVAAPPVRVRSFRGWTGRLIGLVVARPKPSIQCRSDSGDPIPLGSRTYTRYARNY